MVKKILAQAAVILVLAAAPVAAAETPSWLEYDAAKKTVNVHLVAAYNGNNGSWNFNGYYEGGATLVVPLGWKVKMRFANPDGNYAHSVLVTKPYEDDAVPQRAGRDEVTISRAYTRSPEMGCLSCEEMVRFKAKKEGRYYLFCGVVGHGLAGMWIHLVVSAATDKPYVRIAEGAIAPDDQPGYP